MAVILLAENGLQNPDEKFVFFNIFASCASQIE